MQVHARKELRSRLALTPISADGNLEQFDEEP